MFRICLPAFVVVSLLASAPHASAQSSSRRGASDVKVAASGTIVNINTASATDLEGLPGVGAKTAARIVEYRQKNGPFKKVEEQLIVGAFVWARGEFGRRNSPDLARGLR